MYPATRRAPGAASVFSHVLATFAALALVSASAGFGAYFAWSSHAGVPILAALAVTMAIGLEIAKPLAVAGIFRALATFRPFQALGLTALALVAIGYSLVAELQLISLSRADAVASRSHDATVAGDMRAARDRLAQELSRIASARSAAELEPLVAQRTAATRGVDCDQWVENSKLRGECLSLAQLKAEAGRATERAAIAAKLAEADVALLDVGPARVADPSAVALSTYLAALGVAVDPKRLADWLVLVTVLALETGSAFAAVLVAATKPNSPWTPPPVVPLVRSEPDPTNEPERHETSALTTVVTAPNAGDVPVLANVSPPLTLLTVAERPADRVLDLVRQRGGEVFGTQRTLGRAVGISAPHLNRILKDLVGQHRITLETGPRGTRVTLNP